MSQSTLLLDVVEITRETADAITIHLEHPDKKPIAYQAGQYLTLIVPVNGKKERRPYSLSSSPFEPPRLSVTVKRLTNGLISNYLLKQLKVGDKLEVLEPMGTFCVFPQPEATRTLVLIAAGSGITPLMSVAKTILTQEDKSKILLIYGNRNENTVIFKNQLHQLGLQYPNRFLVEQVFSQPEKKSGNSINKPSSFFNKLFGKKPAISTQEEDTNKPFEHIGRLNRSMLIKILEKHQLVDFPDTSYFVCGPEGLMTEVLEALKILKVPANQIFKESFVSSIHKSPDSGTTISGTEENGKLEDQVVTILYEGSEYKLQVRSNETILAAGLAQNIDLPFSCQAGLCTACRGKCLSGKVHLEESEGLSNAEIEEGYVLTCVGHPLTKDVIIQIG